ncbi:MAG: NAD(P)-dependent oxidoreductase [Spirochaetales bacterium]
MTDTRILAPRFERALVIENPHPKLDEELERQGITVERLSDSAAKDPEYVKQRLREGRHDLLFKRSRFIVDDSVLRASDRLAAVVLCCIGDDSVDKHACAEHGVLVLNDPVSNGRSVAELVIGEMILLARRIIPAHEAGRSHMWTKGSHGRHELHGKHLSVIGLGNIGRQVARLAEAFGMQVSFYDQSEFAREVGIAFGWHSCSTLHEAFRTADVVTLHLSAEDPEGQSNEGLLGEEHMREFAADRPSGSPRLFVNAARGFLYDPEALKRAVGDGWIGAAAVDVFPNEPSGSDDPWHNPYADTPEVTTTPHIGAATEDAQPRIAEHVATSAQLLNLHGTVRDTVFSPRVSIGLNSRPDYWALAVIHSDSRGTKKAISDIIFDAGANNIESTHRDFPRYGIAYDLSAIDSPLDDSTVEALIGRAAELSGDERAIRSIRQFPVRHEE